MPVPSLVLGVAPGFVDELDASFNAGAAATSTALKHVNSNAKYGAVRCEQFWGFYRHGETVQLPVSDADGYAYSREELLYSWSRYHSCSSPNPLNGTHDLPVKGPNSGEGTVIGFGDMIDQATGAVTCQTDYYKTSHQVTTDGILHVITHALRNR